jgi:hypothetical protein
VPLLSAEIPLVRYWAREALERLLGRRRGAAQWRPRVDPLGEPGEILAL